MDRVTYRPAVDGLRAIAIASVVGVHAFRWPANGGLGVDLFFVISGFLITTLLLEERWRTHRVALGAFYVRRAYRLVPALVVMLAVYVTVTAVTGGFDGDVAVGAASGVTYTTNLLGVGFDLEPVAAPLRPLWSLAQEEQFYLLWPPVLFLACRGRVRLALAVVGGAIALSAWQAWRLSGEDGDGGRVWYGPDTRGLGVLVGCAAALLIVWAPRVAGLASRVMVPAAVGVVILLLSGRANEPVGAVFRGPLVVFTVCCAVAVVGAFHGRGLSARLLSAAPLVFLGKISYSLYLWHLPVLAAAAALAASSTLAVRAGGVLVALVIATASYYFVELPFLRRKRRAAAVKPPAVATVGVGVRRPGTHAPAPQRLTLTATQRRTERARVAAAERRSA